MTVGTDTVIDWTTWLARWDAQQTGYNPQREERFTLMLDVLDTLFAGDVHALDLACGPGAISQRLLTRFPQATSLAVDTDPVMLALGRGALGDMGGRLRWEMTDLTDAGWASVLEGRTINAVVSSTALHWLPPESLVRVYREIGAALPPGGVFLDADHFAFPPHMPTFARVAETLKTRMWDEAHTTGGYETFSAWWEALEREPGLEDLFAERTQRFGWRTRDWTAPGYVLHEAALRDAGFVEVGTIWQHRDNRILMAVKGGEKPSFRD